MARPLRITYSGAFYHVTSRGYLSSKNKSITGGVVKIVVYTNGILIPFLFHIFRCQGTEDGRPRLNPFRSSSAKNLTGQAEDEPGMNRMETVRFQDEWMTPFRRDEFS